MRDSADLAFVDELLPEEIAEWAPPERLSVSQWADKYRVLDAATSPEPGPWRTDRTPYLRAIMDAFNDPDVEETVVQTSTQVGKTEVLLNLLGFLIDQRPGPCMVVYPTVDVGEDVSRTRIQPMIDSHASLRRRKKGDRHLFTTLRMQFIGMDLFISGANSASSLASKPCEFLLFDEVNKYPPVLGDEADPVSLAKERTKNFPHSKKIFMVSTPTTKAGKITQEIEDCDAVFDYFVPCPHCGELQTLKFPQVRWPEVDKADPDRFRIIQDEATYECEHCKGTITDYHKPEMLRRGQWMAEAARPRQRKIGFRLSSLYSPWIKLGAMAVEFLRSKPFPEKLQNFVNSWLGEPWAEKAARLESSRIFDLCDDRPRGVVPADAVAMTAGVDCQAGVFYYVVRAWGRDLTSFLVREGIVEAFSDLDQVLFQSHYPVVGSEPESRIVNLTCIDSGYRTDEVYDWARRYRGHVRAIKGATHPLRTPFSPSRIDYDRKGRLIPGGLMLWLIDTGYWKDTLLRRIQMNRNDPGAWLEHSEISREYAEQMSSEHKALIRSRKTGQRTERWEKVTQHSPNHFWDASVYSLAAAEMLGVRNIPRQASKPTPRAEPEPVHDHRSSSSRQLQSRIVRGHQALRGRVVNPFAARR